VVSSRKIVIVALATQAALIAVSWWCATFFNVLPHWGAPLRDTGIGLMAACGLGLANHYLLTRAPANWVVNGVRSVYRETIVPLFSGVGPVSAVLIGAAAGVGEEWLFRGILQPLTGVVLASVLFGLAHVGGVRMLPFGVWATAMGAIMGSLALATGGLIAPMVAHGVYDMLALGYIRRGVNIE
jgi:membrane protease YdiL (CAAX protease family)